MYFTHYVCVLAFIFVYTYMAYCTDIAPSLNHPCHNDSFCLTLSQFAANFSGCNQTNVTLTFLPGIHTLDRELCLSYGHNFSITKLDGDVRVECTGGSGRFNIREANFVSIKGLHFIGCGHNTVTKVKWLTIEDTIYQGGGTALLLNAIATANITRSFFISNVIHLTYFATDNLGDLFKSFQDLYLEQNFFLITDAPGALYVAFSNITIDNSSFTNNRADIGGVMISNGSNLHIINTVYEHNAAVFGGVMVTFNSTVNIDQSIFSESVGWNSCGVMLTYYENSFTISKSAFTSNYANNHGGVMVTAKESLFNITNTIFTNNSAYYDCGGVIFTAKESLFNITNTTFTNNYATYGGVMQTHDNASFNIRSSTFTDNNAYGGGGVMVTADESLFNITNTIFANNSAPYGGVMETRDNTSFNIRSSTFTNNNAYDSGGVMFTDKESSFNITNTTFANNSVAYGGVMETRDNTSFNISSSTFTNNIAYESGGAMFTAKESLFNITNTIFTNNRASSEGGVMFTATESSFNIANTTFANNSADFGGVIEIFDDSSFNISSSTFTNNHARHTGGVVYYIQTVFNSTLNFINITNCILTNNSAFQGGVLLLVNNANIAHTTFSNNNASRGGVISFGNNIFNNTIGVINCTFSNNSAVEGAVLIGRGNNSFIYIIECTFTNNSAADIGGVISTSRLSLIVENCRFNYNTANNYGGVMFTVYTSTHIYNSTFDDNFGSLYTFNGNLTFSGHTKLANCAEPLTTTIKREGGAITSFQSTVIFTGVTNLFKNQASRGGAILATESTIIIYGETTIADNVARNGSGGGISLQQSDVIIKGNCKIFNNLAMRGGGIHASSSTVSVYQPWILDFVHNSAENGSGIYLELHSYIYVLKNQALPPPDVRKEAFKLLNFVNNHGNNRGALYVADDTNSGTCSPDIECFIQTLALYKEIHIILEEGLSTDNIIFLRNTATEHGPNIFGGLLDRCIPSPFAEVWLNPIIRDIVQDFSGVAYLEELVISNISLDSVSSQPVKVCFCSAAGQPDCSYQHPPIRVKKGETFNVSLVAVDQVNHTVDANIISSLSSFDGGFGEGQQTQTVQSNCTDLTFNVFSPHKYETIHLHADGPCGSASLSTIHVTVQFTNCTCPVGFESRSDIQPTTRCECICDSRLSPYITNCNSTTTSLLRVNTNSWITYTNDTDPPGYVIHSNCPFDYCKPPTENVSINFNLLKGADKQCAYNRGGVLCGACQQNLSLSLGSSRCLPCDGHWPVVLVIIIIASTVAGILLVTALLALNMTVAVGLINSFIFYANIVKAGSAVFFPTPEPSFPNVFVAWLNLDMGFDVCFFDGLDTYIKTWLQLAFPVYIISLVVIVIKVSQYSTRFVRLIGKRDPVAALATLVLLSYAKLLSVTITVLSPAILSYPNGMQQTLWLPQGNVKYLQGKHIPLFIVAIFITVIGLLYTLLLLFWQWLVRAPTWKVFKWTRNSKLNAFIVTYHVPYNSKHHYWTGLLLLVRLVFYVTASVTMSSNPQTLPLLTIILVGGLLLLGKLVGLRVYKNSLVDSVDTVLYFNVLTLAALSQYNFKTDATKQTAVAYISTLTTFILLVGAIAYHISLLIKKKKPAVELNEYHALNSSYDS